MATENQKRFIGDIEGAIAAIKLKNPDRIPDGLTITEICEMSGRSSVEMRAVVLRMAEKEVDAPLLKRLYDAFMSVNLCPAYLRNVIKSNDTPKDEQKPVLKPAKVSQLNSQDQLIRIDPVPKFAARSGMISNGSSALAVQNFSMQPGEVMNEVMRILDPLPEKQQRRVIVSVSAYYGVGE